MDKEIPRSFKFKTAPYEHQITMLRYHISRPWSAEWGDFGIGKSKVACDLIRWRLEYKQAEKAIILAPANVLPSWKEELEKHSDLSYAIGDVPKRVPDVVVLSYDGLSWKWEKKAGERKRRMVMGQRLMQALAMARNWKCQLICDESTKVKTIKAHRTVSAITLSDVCPFRIIMTGVPIPNDLLDIWSQIRIMDGGTHLGNNFYQWRYKNFFNRPWLPGKWNPKEDTLEKIKDLVGEVGIRFLRDDCLDLPDATYSIRWVKLSDEQRKIYEKLGTGNTFKIEGYPPIDLRYPMVRFTKRYEVLCGFLYFDKERKHVFTFTKNPKHEAAKEMVEDWVQQDNKAVLYTAFREQKNQLYDLFKGYAPTDDFIKFQGDEDRKLFIDHVSQGIGVQLYRANLTGYLSNTFNFEDRVQSEARIRRIGQEKKQYYRDWLFDLHEDRRVYKCLREKKDVSQEVMSDK
ncbi:MAG: SNF2-related protein [Desulfatiglandales bacterium]